MWTSYSMRASAAVLGLSLILAGGPVIAGDATKSVQSDGLRHSGTIVALDQATWMIAIDEMASVSQPSLVTWTYCSLGEPTRVLLNVTFD